MKTYYASPEKANDQELAAEIEYVSKNPITSGLLRSTSGLMAILDRHRQVIAINGSFMKMLGIENPEEALGLRLGEVLQCVHAEKGPAGCGTTEFCSTCGAAVAIVSSIEENIPFERLCALSVTRGEKVVDIALLVRSQPIHIGAARFLLLFIQDITRQEHRAALERAFYHDVNNMLNMLVQASELLVEKHPSELSTIIHHTALRLSREVTLQRCLSENATGSYQPRWGEFTTAQIFSDLNRIFENHPAANERAIEFHATNPMATITTDLCLLSRVLCNMIINALEASGRKETVKVWAEQKTGSLAFFVWNRKEIPKEIAKRIFQRNFSTKSGAGRGVGTYSMKLFGEKILGGKVRFHSSKELGTTFTFVHYQPERAARRQGGPP